MDRFTEVTFSKHQTHMHVCACRARQKTEKKIKKIQPTNPTRDRLNMSTYDLGWVSVRWDAKITYRVWVRGRWWVSETRPLPTRTNFFFQNLLHPQIIALTLTRKMQHSP